MSSSKRVATWLGALIAALVLVTAGAVRADERVASRPAESGAEPAAERAIEPANPEDCPKPPARITIVGKGKTLCIPVHPGMPTRIDLPRGATVYSNEQDERFPVGEMPALPGVPGGEARAYLSAKPDTPVGAQGTAMVMAPTFDATLILRRVERPGQIEERIELVHITEAQAEVQRLQGQLAQCQASGNRQVTDARDRLARMRRQLTTAKARCTTTTRELTDVRSQLAAARSQLDGVQGDLASMTATATDNLDRGRHQGSQLAIRQRLATVAEELDRGPRLLEPVPGSESVTMDRMRVEFEQVKWEGDHLLVWTNLHGLADRPFRLTSARVLAGDDEKEAWIVMPRAPGPDGIIATIYKGEAERVAIAVKLGADAGTEQMELHLFEYGNPKALEAQMPPEYRDGRILYPVSHEQLERERLERERLERARQVIVSARVLVGALWIADGTGQGTLGATSMTGFGVRVVKGFTPSLAFEAEILGSRTGEAKFDNVTVEDMQGDLRRSATLGRLQASGVLRFGDRFIPVFRLGVGVQGASFAAEMTANGDSTTKLDSSFEFTAFVTFGGGVDIRLNDQLLAGISATAETPGGGEILSVSLGAQLGYGW